MAMAATNGHTDELDQSLEYARGLDKKDPLTRMREQFIIPSKADLKRTSSGTQLTTGEVWRSIDPTKD